VTEERPHHVFVDEERRFEHHDPEAFDRVAFAMRMLSILRPPRMTVAVYASVGKLCVERGRELASHPDATWAMVGIPPHASRESIAFALADLVGSVRKPFVVDVLLAAGRGGAS
jgi:hypothetical protein